MTKSPSVRVFWGLVLVAGVLAPILFITLSRNPAPPIKLKPQSDKPKPVYEPRKSSDTSGYLLVTLALDPWSPTASLQEVAEYWRKTPLKLRKAIDASLTREDLSDQSRVEAMVARAGLLNYDGQAATSYKTLEEVRALVQGSSLEGEWLYTVVYFQGVTALRRGEDDNCIMCRGESSCIIPLTSAALHTNPTGSRLAIRHFTEYLTQFPNDLEVRWLLNIAHMTLGEHPNKVDSRYLVNLDRFNKSEFDIGRFRDVGEQVGVNRLNQAGGAIMEDFDNDGLLDIIITSFDATQQMTFLRNKGDGTFEDRTKESGLTHQLGGLYCVQTDYNNDGFMDVFIPRGAWVGSPVRPTLLRNNGNGTFTDVTLEAGLGAAINSISATWADFDNDGFLDLFICCESQPNRLYRNKGDGTFEEVAVQAGIAIAREANRAWSCKGAAWLDFDNDGYPDLFLNHLNGTAILYRNNRNGTFTNVSDSMGIDGPQSGFSCWAWDFDNDGYLDIFATSYDRNVGDVVNGMIGEPHSCLRNRLFRNLGGKGFKDLTKEAGLDMVFSTMGSNFGDFDNDGYLDFYLGTGDPQLSTLVPNRMFKNVGGKRFAEITASSGTGHLQKGHGVACGDWDRNGTLDIFIQMGGAINGDKYHNVLFQNPGQGNNWLNVKLVGSKTDLASKGSNRAAIGARIKAVTTGPEVMTVHRHVSSGSSFGANPLEQHIGLGKADKIALLEIYWPTSSTTQVFRDIPANQAIEISEFATEFKKRTYKPIPLPK